MRHPAHAAASPLRLPQLQLLHHPLSRARLARVAAALEWLTLPVEALATPLPTRWSAGVHTPDTVGHDAVCRSTLTLLHFGLGMVLPLLLSVWRWQPPPAAPTARCGRGLRGAAARGAAATNAALKRLLDMSGGRVAGRALIAWHLLFLSWSFSKLA